MNTENELYVVGILKAAYDRVYDCRKAHDRYQCEVSLEDLRQAEKELETMKQIAAEITNDPLYAIL